MNNPLETSKNIPSTGSGKIVVNADEWTLSNNGFTQAPDTVTFVTNITKWFTGGRGTGKFHAYSTNFGLTESVLAQTISQAGYTWTVGKNIKLDLPTLLTYDGIFLAGDAVDNQVLIDYVKAGGNVYLGAGTGTGGAQAEAASWNTFLNAFGLKFLSVYNGISGNQSVNREHPIFAGVKAIYQSNGNSIVDILDPVPQTNKLLLTHADGQGLIAAFGGSEKTTTTLPSQPTASSQPQTSSPSSKSSQKQENAEETNREEGKRKKRRKKANTIILEFDTQKKDDVRDFTDGRGRLLKKVAKTIARLQKSGEIDDRVQPVIAIVRKGRSNKTFWDY